VIQMGLDIGPLRNLRGDVPNSFGGGGLNRLAGSINLCWELGGVSRSHSGTASKGCMGRNRETPERPKAARQSRGRERRQATDDDGQGGL